MEQLYTVIFTPQDRIWLNALRAINNDTITARLSVPVEIPATHHTTPEIVALFLRVEIEGLDTLLIAKNLYSSHLKSPFAFCTIAPLPTHHRHNSTHEAICTLFALLCLYVDSPSSKRRVRESKNCSGVIVHHPIQSHARHQYVKH